MTDDAVGDTGIVEGSLMVLIVEEFLGEELFEFEPGTRGVRGKVCLPIIACFVHVRALKEMAKRSLDHSGI